MTFQLNTTKAVLLNEKRSDAALSFDTSNRSRVIHCEVY